MDRAKQTEEIVRLLQEVSHSMGHYAPEAWMDLNLTIRQLKSLFFIDFERSTNLSKVANALGVTPPNVTGIIDRLVEQGLVSREENPENRRMMILTVTGKGKTLLAKLRESNRNRTSRVLSELSPEELSALAHALTALARVASFKQGENNWE